MLASRGRLNAQQVVFPLQFALYKFSLLLFAPTLDLCVGDGGENREGCVAVRSRRRDATTVCSI